MKWLVAVTTALFALIVYAHAQWNVVYINNDVGGDVNQFIAKYDSLRAVGTRVVLSGYCNSACTMVLSLPRNQVCVQPGAVLGFHAAFLHLEAPEITRQGTALMATHWTPAVRRWFYSKPLSLELRMRKASDFFPPCR